jgi:hypothetical protein
MLFPSPPLLSNTPVLGSPRSSSPYTNTPTTPSYEDRAGFSRPRQSPSPQGVSAGSHPSLLAQHSPPVGSVFTDSVHLMHPMQGRTVSMPSQRRRRDDQISSTSDQELPVPIPRRRNGTIDMSGNRTARFFDASTNLANGPAPTISQNLSEGERGTNENTSHLRSLRWRKSRSQAEMTASSIALLRPTENQQSYGSYDTSTPSPIRTLLSTGYSTSTTTPQSSQSSSMVVQRHRSVSSWSSRRMSLDSLAPIDLRLYLEDNRRSSGTQSSNLRCSLSSDSSYTDSWLSDAAPASAPSASMPSLILPSRLPPNSALQRPGPAPMRPPRSALRPSSTLSYAASSSATSPLTPVEGGGVSVLVDIEPPKRVSANDDFVNAYFEMPSSARSEDPFELEFRPQPPPTTVHRARGTADHAGTRPQKPLLVVPSITPPGSIAPFSPSDVRPISPATPLMGATTTIKAVHEASGTILLFRVPRMSTSLADLRVKLSRKFLDAENIELLPQQLELRYPAPASAAPNVANRSPAVGAISDVSVNSTHGADGLWLPLNTEADWHMAAANPSGKVTVKVF